MSLINISICLTDLPKDKIKQAENGKKYINLCVASRRETGKYGDTHVVYASQSKEERETKTPVTFVGAGKEFTPQTVTAASVDDMPVADDNNDLPF
jgi:hypothetical protein